MVHSDSLEPHLRTAIHKSDLRVPECSLRAMRCGMRRNHQLIRAQVRHLHRLRFRLAHLHRYGQRHIRVRNQLNPSGQLASKVQYHARRLFIRQPRGWHANRKLSSASSETLGIIQASAPRVLRQDVLRYHLSMSEKARDAVISGPIVQSGIRVPLKHLNVALDRANALHRWPRGIFEARLLPPVRLVA